MPGAVVGPESEGRMVPTGSVQIEAVGVVPPDRLVAIRRRDQRREIPPPGDRGPAELGRDTRMPRLRPDRGDPTKPLLDRGRDEPCRIAGSLGELPRLEKARERRPGRVTRLLHPSEQD